MNLSDHDILELTELCNAVVDHRLTAPQKERLQQWLKQSEPARQFYVRFLGLSASLAERAAEMQAEEPDAPPANLIPLRPWWPAGIGALAAAAAIALLIWILGWPSRSEPTNELAADEAVARLTGTKDSRWSQSAPTLQPGEILRRHQKLELLSGFAEITFDSGAQVQLEGPAAFEIHSAWEATLLSGTLKASVPREAIGFRISNPRVEIVDLGTEFSMIADPNGGAEVFVLKGSVEARDHETTAAKPLVLREKQARRFARDGVSEVKDRDRKFARLSRQIRFDHSTPIGRSAHWSFDNPLNGTFKPELFGPFPASLEAQCEPFTASETFSVPGPFQRALHFDGRLTAKIHLPGLSTNLPGTIAFWVKIPPQTDLSDAGAMLSWTAAQTRKSGLAPMHIGWNSNPSQGVLGALRADIFRWYIVGSTSLRDGQWHHVALVFAPRERTPGGFHVKQYVDAHFEGASASTFGKQRVQAAALAESGPDLLYLGARLGRDNKIRERFLGDLDELYLSERPLTPPEIKSLMLHNRLSRPDLASAPQDVAN